MMSILSALVSGPRFFRGEGINEEGEPFAGSLRVESLEGGRAALLRYCARIATGQVVHSETALLGMSADGSLCLWPVMSELANVLPHRLQPSEDPVIGETSATFSTGARHETMAFREEITLRIRADNSVVYAHAWGLPGGEFDDRSSCSMVPDAHAVETDAADRSTS